MPSLHEYLKSRLLDAYRELSRSLAGLSEADARAGASVEWRRYRYGIGLDGSIAGMVWHVAAWKHVLADGIEGGVFPDVEAVLPHDFGWSGLLHWLESGHARLARALEELKAEDLERLLTLEGRPTPLLSLFSIAMDHDRYHAGQVNLLRQQMGHVFSNEE
jgi:uncharacterized damage-inducible protein DinB